LGRIAVTGLLPDWKIHRLKRLAGSDAVGFAYTIGADSAADAEWVCVCGTHNPLDWDKPRQNCSKCGRERDATLADYSEEALGTEPSPPAESHEVAVIKDRKAAKNAGVAVIIMGVVVFLGGMLVAALLGEEPVRQIYSSTDVVIAVLIGLLLIGLGVGTLFKNTFCLGLAVFITALFVLWNIVVRLALGLEMRMIGLLILQIFLLISMLRGFGPLRRLKAAPLQPSQSSQPPQPRQPVAGPGRLLKERFAEVEALRKKGLITDEEYQAKRKELLESL